MKHKDEKDKAVFVGPIPWIRLSYEEALREEYRFLDCLNYSRCLQFAAANHWDGFSCRECFWWKLLKEGGKDGQKV